MNRLSTRLLAGVVGLVATVGIAGCGTGQISQTADQRPAVNGTEGVTGQLALRDVRIQVKQTADFVEPGRSVDLLFVVTNSSPQAGDELTEIQSDIGTVTVTGSKSIPLGGILAVGTPVGQDKASLTAMQKVRSHEVNTATATVALTQPITSGVSYRFTFTFAQSGSVELQVPVSSAEETPRVLAGD